MTQQATQPPAETLAEAREIAALFYDKRDPLDASYRDIVHNIRRGRYDSQEAVELVRFTLAHLAALTLRAGGDAIPAEMTPEERRLEHLKQMAAYAGPIVSFEVRDPYYLASCDGCGWVGSSEACGTDEADDVFCPRCFRGGADCGRVAERVGTTPKPPAGGDAIPAGEEWPVKWAGPLTVGNMIANLRTLPADMPIHSAYHLVREGKPARLFVKHPTVSRERVDGREIKTGDESVPYSAVIWSHGREPEIATPKPPAGGDAETKGWDHRYRSLAWGEVILDTDECRRDDGTWVTGICVGQKAPDPAYTSHRVYRRLIAPAGGDAGELAAFGASDAACTLYPGEDQAAERAAFVAGAALALPAPVVEGVTEREVDALRYVLNWADSRMQARTILKAFTVEDGEKVTNEDRLERLWRKLSAALSEGRSHG